MTKTIDDVTQQFIDDIANLDIETNECSTAVKSLKTLAEARKLLEPDPIPEPEPTGWRAFLKRNSSDLIKGGVTLTVVGIIALVEAKGEVIFRSKATKYL